MAALVPPQEHRFHGVTLPIGVERKVLYHSSYRAIATYAMSLADLDYEFQNILHAGGLSIKDDWRADLCGKLDVITAENTIIHCLMDRAGMSGVTGSGGFVQLKVWVDY